MLLSDQNTIRNSAVNLIEYENNNTSIILQRGRISNCSIIEQFDISLFFLKKNI